MPVPSNLSNPKEFGNYIKTEMGEGKPQKQAVAIAYSEKRRQGGTDQRKNDLKLAMKKI